MMNFFFFFLLKNKKNKKFLLCKLLPFLDIAAAHEARALSQAAKDERVLHASRLRVPRRPPWTNTTSKSELLELEREVKSRKERYNADSIFFLLILYYVSFFLSFFHFFI